MKRVLLVAAAVLAMTISLAACSDSFNPPEQPDLHKDPYDFAVVVPPFDGDGGADMAGADMRGSDVHDLATSNSD